MSEVNDSLETGSAFAITPDWFDGSGKHNHDHHVIWVVGEKEDITRIVGDRDFEVTSIDQGTLYKNDPSVDYYLPRDNAAFAARLTMIQMLPEEDRGLRQPR